MQLITNWDYEVLLWIQDNLRTPFGNAFFRLLTFLGEFGWFWIVYCCVLILRKKTRRSGIVIFLALAISFALGEGLIKHLVMRTRPYIAHADLIALARKPLSSSFPSGHSASSIAVGTQSVKEFHRKGIPVLILACLVAFSRLYLGMHYPTDVIAGVLLGLFSAFLASWIAARFAACRKKKAAIAK